VAEEPVFEPEPGRGENPVVEAAPVVDHNHDLSPGAQRAARVCQNGGDIVAVSLHAAADLLAVAPFEAEELIGVRVLLVVVDETRIGRRGQHEVDRRRRIHEPRIAVQYVDGLRRARLRELLHPLHRVTHVAPEKLLRLPHRPAHAPVLVAEVLAVHRLRREVEIVVPRKARRTGRAREDDLPELRVGGAFDPLAEGHELSERARRIPAPEIPSGSAHLRTGLAFREPDDVCKESGRFVDTRLRPHQQAVERGDVTAGGAGAERVCLD
jgi:hypothetical protein